MKKLFLCLALTVFSSLSFAQITELQGVVKSVECNRPTGYGIMEIHKLVGKTLQISVLKVDSKDLCSKKVESKYSVVTANVSNPVYLTELAFQNNIKSQLTTSTITIDQDRVVAVEDLKQVSAMEYSRFKKVMYMTDAAEVWNWFFSVRGY